MDLKGEEDDIDFAVVGIDEKDVEEENCSLVPTDRQVLPRSWDHQAHKVQLVQREDAVQLVNP